MNFMRILAFALLAFLSIGSAHAAIPAQACLAPLSKGKDAAHLMARPELFDCYTQQTHFGQGDFLAHLRFPPVKTVNGDPQVLRMASIWHEGGSVLFRYADGSAERLEFSARSVSHYVTIGSIYEFPVPVRNVALTDAFIEVRGAANTRGVILMPNLMSLRESYSLKVRLVAGYAMFGGVALTLIVYNLSLWNALRHRFQLYYCGMLAALSAYMCTSSGILAMLVPALENNDRVRLGLILLGFAHVIALQFVRNFFEPAVFGRRLTMAINISSVLSLVTTLLFAALVPWKMAVLQPLYVGAMLVMLVLVVVILVNAWRVRSRYFWYFLPAWFLPMLVACLRVAQGFNLLGYSFWLENSNLAAIMIEALVSALMVSARVREVSLERDDAVASEQVALRLANTDPLTGLLNRRAFMELAIGRTAVHRLMLIDVDHFKKVNDRLGHEVGDQVLTHVAKAIQQCRPARSLAVRLGGEEFGILLPRSSFDSCTSDMILKAIREAEMPRGEKVTVSIGYADGIVSTEKDWKRLYRFADSALYRAKSDGRDRACRATDFSVAA